MAWVKVFGLIAVGIGLVVVGMSRFFGDCESFERSSGTKNDLECMADASGSMSRTLVGGFTIGVGVIVFGIGLAIVIAEFRRPSRRSTGRR